MFEKMAAKPRLRPFSDKALPTYFLLAAFWTLVFVGFATTRFTYDGSLTAFGAQLGAVLICAMGFRYLSFPRFAGTIEVLALKTAVSAAAALGSAILASANLPLIDETLNRWDAALGFDWLAFMRWLEGRPTLIQALYRTYGTLTYQMFLIVPALFITRNDARAWIFVLAWGLALACSMSLFPLFPAVGPIVHFDYQLPGIPWKNEHMDVFTAARDGSLSVLGVTTIRGMVTFPSFHVAGAIILAWAAWPLKWLRWPFVALNALMCVSAIPIGGHYLVDVIAGVGIAAIGIVLASIIMDRVWRRALRNERAGFHSNLLGLG